MDAPSPELVRRLREHTQVTASDLGRCRARVKRFAQGLPAFDAVWVDALVAEGKLTRLQAQWLEQGKSDQLRVGQRFLIESQRQIDLCLPTFDALEVDSQRSWLVSRYELRGQSPAQLTEAFKPLIQITRQHSQPGLPVAVVTTEQSASVIARAARGDSLDQFLIRRGRFPERVVRTILRRICQQLVDLDIPHGDLRPGNVFLSQHDELALINWGVLSILEPEINIHIKLPEHYLNGIAPERINTGLPATKLTDVYALGCLCWHLLAGRPPLMVAEPLAKLTAHQTRNVPEISNLVPDVSPELSRLIAKMTSHEPHHRPQSAAAVLKHLLEFDRVRKGSIEQFVQAFESAAPRQTSHAPKKKFKAPNPLTMAAVILLSLAGGWVAWNRPTLNLPSLSQVSAATEKDEFVPLPVPDQIVPEIEVRQPESHVQEIPAPDENGVITLAAGNYVARPLNSDHPLTIRGSQEAPTRITMESTWEIKAPVIHFENIWMETQFDEEPAVNLAANDLIIIHSVLKRDGAGKFIAWKPSEQTTSESGRLLIRDSRIECAGGFLEARLPTTSMAIENCFVTGGTALDLQAGVRQGLRVPVVLNNCTFRESGPLVAWNMLENPAVGRLSIQGSNTIWQSRSDAPMLQVTPSPDWEQYVEIVAQGLIVPEESILLGDGEQPLDTSMLIVDGILAGAFHFADDPEQLFRQRVVVDRLPIRTEQPPGCALDLLPYDPRVVD